MNDLIPFGVPELSVLGIYLLSLLAVGWAGLRARRENSMHDFYLAGGGLGFVVLLLTLYATQYSGNTLFGFTGKTYRIGLAWATSIHFMTAIVVFYLIFAPKLYAQSKRKGFVTPTDYLDDRFCHRGLNVVATLVMVVAISNYLLAQLTAMGRALEGLTRLPADVAFNWGVVILALIILIYEILGGMRAVVWTDVIQGAILIVAFMILFGLVIDTYGSLGQATKRLLDPELGAPEKVLPPTWQQCRQWVSYVLLVGIGGALYPQAIQRIYAARSALALRRSLAVMAFLPLTTALVALIIGLVGAAYVVGLEGAAADRILPIICRHIQEQSTFGHWLIVIFFAGVLAAIMSTADSVLLSVSSMLTKDLYRPLIRPAATEGELTRFGKLSSAGLLVLLAALAIYLNSLENRPTLIKLLDKKFDILVQLAPAFMLGVHYSWIRGGAVLWGMLTGLTIALGMSSVVKDTWGIHPGLYGLVVNATIAVIGSRVVPQPVQSGQNNVGEAYR